MLEFPLAFKIGRFLYAYFKIESASEMAEKDFKFSDKIFNN